MKCHDTIELNKSLILSAETGLYYLNSRYYDPEVGRFISPDSLDYLDPENINGLNLYAYCKNNPIMNVDPSGKAWLTILLIIGISALIGAIDGGITAAMSGQNFWLGFAAGAIGGAVGGIFTAATLGIPWGGIIARFFSSLTYGFLNEIFQNGSIENMDWGLFVVDVVMDTMFSMLYAGFTSSVGEQLANIFASKVFTKNVFSTMIGGLIEGIIDILQTIMYMNLPKQPQRVYS